MQITEFDGFKKFVPNFRYTLNFIYISVDEIILIDISQNTFEKTEKLFLNE